MYLCIYLCIYLVIYLFIYSFIHSFIHSFIMASYMKYNMIKAIKEKKKKEEVKQWISNLQYNYFDFYSIQSNNHSDRHGIAKVTAISLWLFFCWCRR